MWRFRRRLGAAALVLAGVLVPAAATADVATITRAATAARPAVRIDASREQCSRIAAAIDGRHPGSTQHVIVRTREWTDTTAVLQVATRTGATWTCQPEMPARIGRNGYRPLTQRRSGDGTAPAGVFRLGTMTAWDGQRFSFFGNAPDPGVRAGGYRYVRRGDCFGATPNTPGFGHLRNDAACTGGDDEYLPDFVGSYSHAALIGANTEPDVSGDAPGEIPYAAAIFLHRHAYVNPAATSGETKPTSGCVSLALEHLRTVLVGMRADVLFVMGPTEWLLTTA